MPQAVAEETLKRLPHLPLTVVPTPILQTLLPRTMQIGLTYQLAIYDLIYIALAESLDCPLITVDQKQSKAASTIGVTIKQLADFKPA